MFVESGVRESESSAAVSEPKKSVAKLAAEAIELSEGDTAGAAERLLKALKLSLPEVYSDIQSRAMMNWAMAEVRNAKGAIRSIIERRVGTDNGPSRITSMVRYGYLDWQLGEVTLRNATRQQIEDAVKKYRHDATVYLRRAKWLEAVAKKLPDDETTVGDALSEEQLAQIASRFKI